MKLETVGHDAARGACLAQQQVEGDAFEEQLSVGFGLADLAAVHRIGVVDDEEAVRVGDLMFMVEKPG
ncbi:MAG: hypothetical protein E8D42_13320 [Nitrospira sp.]|nr:MAG: hypothetical protein E8D42_13320 [Nitrospira sp.]